MQDIVKKIYTLLNDENNIEECLLLMYKIKR